MRFLPGDHGKPDAWLLSGKPAPLAQGRIWDHIAPSLLQQPAAACLQSGDIVLTRAEVEQQARHIADRLRGARVGIHVSRSLASVIATLATWRIGAAYVPLPTESPPARPQIMIESARLDMVVSDTFTTLDGYLPAGDETTLFAKAEPPSSRVSWKPAGRCSSATTCLSSRFGTSRL